MAKDQPYVNKKTVFVASDYGNVQRAGELKDLANLTPSGQSLLGTVLPSGASTVNTPNLTGGVTIKPTPALAQTANQILADPKAFVQQSPAEPGKVGFLDRGKDLLGRIFDYEDKADLSIGPVSLSGVESVWDGFLRGMDWFYDRINQLGTAGISALPGGTRTLTYDEAGDVSFGQEFVANAGISAGRIRRGEGGIGDYFAVSSIPGIAAFAAPDSPIQQPGFDITSEQDRKAFETGYEKFFSGLTDTFYSVFADPLIVGGKVAKVTKLRYLTRPLNSDVRQKQFVDNLDRGVEDIINGVPVEKTTPEAQFLYWAVGGTDNTRVANEILDRAEIQDQGMEGVAVALELLPRSIPEADRLRLGRDVMAATFSAEAKDRLLREAPLALAAIATAERKKLGLQLTSDLSKYPQLLREYTKKRDDAKALLDRLEADNKRLIEDVVDRNVGNRSISGNVTGADVEAARAAYDDLDVTVTALENGTLPDPVLLKQGKEAIDAMYEDAVRKNAALQAAIRAAEQQVHPSETYGFAADNKFGRFVTSQRAKRATAKYQYRNTYANKESTYTDFFGNSKFVNTIRVWRWPGVLRPGGYLRTDGINDVDGITEVDALLNSLAFLAGQGKKIEVPVTQYNPVTMKREPKLDADGNILREERVVGGVALKRQIMSDFMRAYGTDNAMGTAAELLEDRIKTEMSLFYDVSPQVIDDVVNKALRTRAEVKANLVDQGRKFFAEPDPGSDLAILNKAPHLESQLRNGMYMLPFDALERVVRRIEKKARSGITDPNVAIFNWQNNLAIKSSDYLNNFYDFWRPAVLFRLGYPQRNVTEGNFRSMAFLASVAPLAWAGKGLVYGTSNIGRARRVEKRIAGLREKMGKPDVTRDKFDDLVRQQTELREEQFALRRKAHEYENPGRERPASISFAKLLAEKDNYYATADDGVMVVRELQPDGSMKWAVYERTATDATDPTGNALPTRVEGLPVFNTETLAIRALDTMVNDLLKDLKATGQPSQAAKVFMEKPGSFIGSLLETGLPREVQPLEINGKVVASLDDIERTMLENTGKIDALEAQIKDFGGRPISPALKNTRFEKWRAQQLDALDERIESDMQWIDNARELAQGTPLTRHQQDILIFLRDQVRDLENQRVALERDDVYALNQYGRQASAKRRVDNGGTLPFTPGVVLHSAFGDPRFADIAWSEASADNTTRAALSLRLDFGESVLFQKNFQTYREVTPDMGDAYWNGMADYLQQFHFDPIGKKILAGEPVEKIATWLLGTTRGRATRDSIDERMEFRNPPEMVEAMRIGNSMQQAQAFINRIATGFYRITLDNKSVSDALLAGPVTPEFLRAQLGDAENLFPVVGHTDEITGNKSLMQSWRTLTGKAFRVIGTLPEDALVRGPFYSKRYDQARAQMMQMLEGKYAGRENIPLSEALNLEQRAHRTAIRDTKKYLYTIDRRTNLATYGEHVIPFITATQNSVTTLGRLIYKDPSLPGIMLALWSAPNRVGWEDEQGNIRIPLPDVLIPDGVEKFFGIEGFENILINKDSLNVIFPESGFAFVPRPTPLVQAAASELMKNGFFGQFGVEAPQLLVKFMGKKDADTVWQYWKNYIFGEESAISPEFLSYDKITPPTFNRIVQLIQGDSANQYAYQYGLQARTLDLMWRAGQLDEYPTAEEVTRRTNGMFFLRWLGNAFAFTPPTYESPVDTLIQMQREYDRVYGILGPQKFSENFGNETLILANTETAENVGGTTVTVDTVRNINKYESLIKSVAPMAGDDLNVLGILVNPDPGESAYDTNAYRWMTTTNIPGTTRKWREINSGQEAMYEAQRQAGWVEYIKFKNSLDAMLQERGLSSYRVKDAAQLNEWRKQFIDNMMQNPLYEGWKQDFLTPGSTKTRSALKVIQAAVDNEDFMADHQDDKTWWMATQYLAARQQVVDYIAASGESATHQSNEQILIEWDAFRQDLINQDIGWASIANRYLLADDEPDDLGTSFMEE